MVVIYLDPNPILAELAEIKGRFQEAIAQGFAEAGRKMVDIFRHDWLSGRGADGLGLTIVTGILNQSVRSLTTIRPGGVTSEVFNRDADYWWYHEYPEGGHHQYLHLEDSFETVGGPLYEDAIEQALRMVA